MDGGDAKAMFNLGGFYKDGLRGMRRNMAKAVQLWLRAGELGDARGYCNIGAAYSNGEGVEREMKKGKYYYELAAMGGDVIARHHLGVWEMRTRNMDRAVKHWMISARAGYDKSLKAIQECFMNSHATKGGFEKALRAHKEAKDEMKSDQREAAAKFYGQI